MMTRRPCFSRLALTERPVALGSTQSQRSCLVIGRGLMLQRTRCHRRSRLLRWARDTRLRRSWHHRYPAETHDVRRKGRGPVRQAGLRLFAGKRRVSLPVRRTAALSLHQCREWDDIAPLLVRGGLPGLLDKEPMHAIQGTPDHPGGSMNMSLRKSKDGSTQIPMPCGRGERRLSTPSAWFPAIFALPQGWRPCSELEGN